MLRTSVEDAETKRQSLVLWINAICCDLYLTIVLNKVDLASLWNVIITEVASSLVLCFFRLHLRARKIFFCYFSRINHSPRWASQFLKSPMISPDTNRVSWARRDDGGGQAIYVHEVASVWYLPVGRQRITGLLIKAISDVRILAIPQSAALDVALLIEIVPRELRNGLCWRIRRERAYMVSIW